MYNENMIMSSPLYIVSSYISQLSCLSTELQAASGFHCHTVPTAEHCQGFLETSVRLWLYLHCDAK